MCQKKKSTIQLLQLPDSINSGYLNSHFIKCVKLHLLRLKV